MLAFAFSTINAQDAAVPQNPNGPDIKFVNAVHDYGTIIQGADGNCEFKFKNTGKDESDYKGRGPDIPRRFKRKEPRASLPF